jgi:predicted ATPase
MRIFELFCLCNEHDYITYSVRNTQIVSLHNLFPEFLTPWTDPLMLAAHVPSAFCEDHHPLQRIQLKV